MTRIMDMTVGITDLQQMSELDDIENVEGRDDNLLVLWTCNLCSEKETCLVVERK